MKKYAITLAALLLSALMLPLSLWAFGTGGSAAASQPHSKKFTKAEVEQMAKTTATIKTSFGDIKLRFLPEVAPNHVDNFIELAKKGFYDGTVFHRVIPGFMIQGGDPNSKSPVRASHGTGGPGYTVKAEFNNKPHVRGTLSAARSMNPDSAGSQFFICVDKAPHLDGQYTVFGEVVSGMKVVDKIVSQPRDTRDNPLERVEITVVIDEGGSEEAAPGGK